MEGIKARIIFGPITDWISRHIPRWMLFQILLRCYGDHPEKSTDFYDLINHWGDVAEQATGRPKAAKKRSNAT